MNDDPKRSDPDRFETAIYGLPVGRPDDVARGREPIEVLASEFCDALRKGAHPSIDDYARRYPELAAEIRSIFPMVAAMEDWKAFRERTAFDHRALDALPGTEHFGGYKIVREIGRGGMGIVFEAREEASSRRVAIKVLPFIRSQALREGFEREARIATGLRHPHIVPVYSCGEHEGLCYYVMKMVEGVGLDWLIQRLGGREGVVYFEAVADHFGSPGREPPGPASARPAVRPLAVPPRRGHAEGDIPAGGLARNSWGEIARIGAQVADALQYAHGKGTLHRDVKPANLLLDSKGEVWITDFGLARDEATISEPEGNVAGTLRYIAPERFSGRIDARSDIYSLGVTLFELLTRKPAFQGEDRKSMIETVSRSVLLRPRQINPKIPRDLEAIVIKATAKDPDWRYSTAAELRADLLRFILGRRVRARGVLGWFKHLRS